MPVGEHEAVAVRPGRVRPGRSGGRSARGRRRRARAPSGAPGCPEFAFCTASMDSVRMVSMASFSIPGWGTGTPDVGKRRCRADCLFLAHRRARHKAQVGVGRPGGRVASRLQHGRRAAAPFAFVIPRLPGTLAETDVRHARGHPRAALPQREAKYRRVSPSRSEAGSPSCGRGSGCRRNRRRPGRQALSLAAVAAPSGPPPPPLAPSRRPARPRSRDRQARRRCRSSPFPPRDPGATAGVEPARPGR